MSKILKGLLVTRTARQIHIPERGRHASHREVRLHRAGAREGGSWHVESMRNERIVATACVYLESDNISESRIELRTAVSSKRPEGHGGRLRPARPRPTRPTARVVPHARRPADGETEYPPAPRASVRARRSFTPGKANDSVLILVDPTPPVQSTATVPPHINDWVSMEADKALPKALWKGVRDHVGKWAGGMSVMKRHEQEVVEVSGKNLMDESPNFFERDFSLCEH